MFRRDLLWVFPLTLVTLFLMTLLVPSILWLVGIPWFILTLGLGIGLSLIGLPPTIAFIAAAIVSAALGLCLLICLYPPPPRPARGDSC